MDNLSKVESIWKYPREMTYVLDFAKCWVHLRHRDIKWKDEHTQFLSFFK